MGAPIAGPRSRLPRAGPKSGVAEAERRVYRRGVFARTKLAIAVGAIAGLSFTAIAIDSQNEARATPVIEVQQSNPTITITNEGLYYTFSPAQLDAQVGQPITVVNEDRHGGVHSVVDKGRTFSVDVPPQSSTTLTVSKAGNYQYFCDWHADSHEPKYGSLNVS